MISPSQRARHQTSLPVAGILSGSLSGSLRRRRRGRFDWNLTARLLRLLNRHGHLEYSVFEPCLSLFSLGALRQRNRAVKASVLPFGQLNASFVLVRFRSAFAFDDQRFVSEFQFHIGWIDSRQLGAYL